MEGGKVKKNQVKEEFDRIKQDEKKKRRLKKALAASAAIISELENKKQNKNQKTKEEQQRLDQAKDGFDRMKQAEKKKRRIKKALATSAAIISELEKKKEEQQRLDEECAAIAEAVALHVLIGEESDKSCVQAMMHNSDEEWYPWGYCTRKFDLFGSDSHARTTATVIPHSCQLGWVSDRCGGSGFGFSDGRYFLSDVRDWEAEEATSSLQITDDRFNKMLRW